ncbi:hypothetical protein MMC17_003395 [Xylographa soralifera]|nr:hypothetical protein [Xylographa soralifera]
MHFPTTTALALLAFTAFTSAQRHQGLESDLYIRDADAYYDTHGAALYARYAYAEAEAEAEAYAEAAAEAESNFPHLFARDDEHCGIQQIAYKADTVTKYTCQAQACRKGGALCYKDTDGKCKGVGIGITTASGCLGCSCKKF